MRSSLSSYEKKVLLRLSQSRKALADYLEEEWLSRDATTNAHPPALHYIYNVILLALTCVTINSLYAGNYIREGQPPLSILDGEMMGEWLITTLTLIEFAFLLVSLGIHSVAKQSVYPRWIECVVLRTRPRSAQLFDAIMLIAKIVLCSMMFYADSSSLFFAGIVYSLFVFMNNVAYRSTYKMEIMEAVRDIETTGEIGRSTFMDDFPAPGGH